MNRKDTELAPWIRLHREFQMRWADHVLSKPLKPEPDVQNHSICGDESEERERRHRKEEVWTQAAAASSTSGLEEDQRIRLRAATFAWLSRDESMGGTESSGEAPDSTALVLRNSEEDDRREFVWRGWVEAESASYEQRLARLEQQQLRCVESLGITRTQLLRRLSADPEPTWLQQLLNGFETGDDAFHSLLQKCGTPHRTGLDSWGIEHGCEQSDRYDPVKIQSHLQELLARHPRRTSCRIRRSSTTFLPRVLPLVSGGPVLVLSGSRGIGAILDSLEAFGRMARDATVADADRLDDSFFGDPANSLAAGFLFRWTLDYRANRPDLLRVSRLSERVRLHFRVFLATDAESFERESSRGGQEDSGFVGSLPVHPGWRAQRTRANPLAAEVLRAAIYAVLQEEYLKTRFGLNWPRDSGAWRWLEDLWVSELGSTMEKVADGHSLGKIESVVLLDRLDPRRVLE